MSWTIWPSRPAALRSVGLSLALLLSLCPEMAMSVGQECMASYYRTKSPACVDGLLTEFRQAPRAGSDPNTVIGFLAELFRSSPQERDRILSAEPSDYFKSVHLVSLYRAVSRTRPRNLPGRTTFLRSQTRFAQRIFRRSRR